MKVFLSKPPDPAGLDRVLIDIFGEKNLVLNKKWPYLPINDQY